MYINTWKAITNHGVPVNRYKVTKEITLQSAANNQRLYTELVLTLKGFRET